MCVCVFLVFFSFLCLTLQRRSHEGGSHCKVQPNVSYRGRDVHINEQLLSHSSSNTSFPSGLAALASSSSSVTATQAEFLVWIVKTGGQQWCCIVTAAWGLSAQTQTPVSCHCQASALCPLPSAFLSITHPALISLSVCQQEPANISAPWRSTKQICLMSMRFLIEWKKEIYARGKKREFPKFGMVWTRRRRICSFSPLLDLKYFVFILKII